MADDDAAFFEEARDELGAARQELAQVAAMAARWAVSIPRGRIRPPWAKRKGSA